MGFDVGRTGDDGRTARHHIIFLLLLGILLYFVGNSSLCITDPVESNYTLTAKEMIAAGDLVSPRIYGNYWYDKPVFFYWELIAAFEAFGQTDFAARFFPGLWSVVIMLLTYGFGRRWFGERVGFFAAILFGTSVEGWYVGHAVITDTTLVAALSGMLIAFFTGYMWREKRWYYLAFALAGVAVLTKGPIGLCLPGLIILVFLAWEQRLKELLSIHILLGFVLFFAVCALWYVPMVQLHGTDFLDTFLGVHNVLRATVSEHPDQNVWYFYLLVFLGGCFPWSLAVLPAVVKKLFHRDVHLPKTPEVRFLVVWAVCVFATFQCFATKYITYTFPYMVPMAILFARYFVQHAKLVQGLAGFMTALLVAAACFIGRRSCAIIQVSRRQYRLWSFRRNARHRQGRSRSSSRIGRITRRRSSIIPACALRGSRRRPSSRNSVRMMAKSAGRPKRSCRSSLSRTCRQIATSSS